MKAEIGISATSEYHFRRAQMLYTLGHLVLSRYHRTRNMGNLKPAILKVELAIFTTSEGHPLRANLLYVLGVMLLCQFNRTRNEDNLEAAIYRAEMAVAAFPKNDTARSYVLIGLADCLSSRYHQTGNMNDLTAAILRVEMALSATPEDHPNRAEWLTTYGINLLARFYQTTIMDCLQAALTSFTDSVNLSNARPLTRVRAARAAILILATFQKWDQARSLAMELLPFICYRYLSRQDQQFEILQISGFAADACSISLKGRHVHQALRYLEFGRGVILCYLIDGRSDLTNLQHDDPALANEYDAIRFQVYADIEEEEPVIRQKLLKKRRDAANRLEHCLHRIRQKVAMSAFSSNQLWMSCNRVLRKGQLS